MLFALGYALPSFAQLGDGSGGNKVLKSDVMEKRFYNGQELRKHIGNVSLTQDIRYLPATQRLNTLVPSGWCLWAMFVLPSLMVQTCQVWRLSISKTPKWPLYGVM